MIIGFINTDLVRALTLSYTVNVFRDLVQPTVLYK
jgi:hypothetical protein